MKKIGLLFVTIIMLMLFAVSASAETEKIKVQSVSLKSEYVIYEGEFLSLNPTIKPETATDKSYTITGSNSGDYEFNKYISITTSGFLNGKKATVDSSGNAFYFTVTVRTNDGGKTATTKVKVLPKMIYVEYNGIDSSPWYYGNTAKLSASLNDELVGKYSLSDIRFKSDNESIATVSNDGIVTCKGVGDVVITAYIPGTNYSGDFKLYSRKGLQIDDTFFDSCQVGKTYQISAQIKPNAGSDSILYYTSNSSVATVDSNGLVSFKKAGTVTITVLNASDPFNPKYVWMTSNKFTAPSSSASQLLSSMKTTANALKSRTNLPSVTRFEDATATNFYLSSNKLSAAELQSIFSSVLTPKNNYYAPVVANNTNYTTLKNEFMANVPVAGQSYLISSALTDSDVQSINLTNNDTDYCYEIKLTLKEETMPSLPTSPASTRHGKVFDILTSSYIDTHLNKINSESSLSVTYGAFSQRYYGSSLTLRINKATGNIERAIYDMNLDVNVTSFKMKYSILLSYTTDISFKVNNIICIDFSERSENHTHSFTNYISDGTATCITDGKLIAKCDNCSATDIKPIKGTHNFDVFLLSKYPTCSEEGEMAYFCKWCELKDESSVIKLEKLAHNFKNDWQAITLPTCTNTGVSIRICNNCLITESKIENAKGHSFNGSACTDCGYNKADNCSCNCHKTGLFAIIWKIINIFNKLLKKNPICSCGAAHY